VPTHSKVVALTIDDAPHPAVTPKILEALQALGVKATFFVIGSQAEQWPQLLLDIASQVGPTTNPHRVSHACVSNLSARRPRGFLEGPRRGRPVLLGLLQPLGDLSTTRLAGTHHPASTMLRSAAPMSRGAIVRLSQCGHAQGHEVGNHLMEDEAAYKLTPEQFETQLLRVDGLLQPHFGLTRWFRPGHGWIRRWMFPILERHGYRTALGRCVPPPNTYSCEHSLNPLNSRSASRLSRLTE